MFKNPFSFKGRIGKTEYLYSIFLIIIIRIILLIVIDWIAHKYNDKSLAELIYYFFEIITIWFALAQGTKRSHDIGKSGLWQFIPFYSFWLIFENGQKLPNKYGESF